MERRNRDAATKRESNLERVELVRNHFGLVLYWVYGIPNVSSHHYKKYDFDNLLVGFKVSRQDADYSRMYLFAARTPHSSLLSEAELDSFVPRNQ